MAHRRLRVLTLIDVLHSDGGAERTANIIAASLDPTRFESWVCSTRVSRMDHVVRELEDAGARIVYLPRRGKLDLLAWRPLIEVLRRERIDVIHGHKFGSNVWAAALGRLCRVPVVVTHEQTWSYVGRPVRRFLDRELIARGSDAFISVSPEDRRRMIELEHIPPEKIRLIMNAVPDHTPSEHDLRGELGIPAGVPVIGMVGRIRAQKAHEFFVDVVAELHRQFPDLRALIAGDADPGLQEQLEQKLVELRLDDTVTLLGRRDDVADVVEALDIAVLSSDYEGTPLAVMEYMAAAKPIVATRVGGVPALIEDGVHGLLVEARDTAGMTAAIASLIEDPGRAAELGRAAAARRREEFAAAALVRRVEDLYEELFARSARGRAEGWSPPPAQPASLRVALDR